MVSLKSALYLYYCVQQLIWLWCLSKHQVRIVCKAILKHWYMKSLGLHVPRFNIRQKSLFHMLKPQVGCNLFSSVTFVGNLACPHLFQECLCLFAFLLFLFPLNDKLIHLFLVWIIADAYWYWYGLIDQIEVNILGYLHSHIHWPFSTLCGFKIG